ncbi:MAG: glycoside hydrolase family 18 protein, partial [Clostridia bacterium]|nr:glycoside hydrolase family 18 protein [Clostridia bacterium]
DGVHFDYEYPIKLKHWNKFSDFLIRLDEVMPDKLIGLAICEWSANIKTRAIEAVDYFELMMYDIYDDADGKHSTYEKATKLSHEATMMGIPVEKLHFGLPFYARPTDHDAYWYDYIGYHDKLDENNFYYDEALQKSFWFNTPDVTKAKTEYAMENGFGGVMIWHYTCDLPSTNPDSLLRAVGEAKGAQK